MVFCEAKCRHGTECDALIAADRPHPRQGAYYLHHATVKGEAHTWRSLAATVNCKGQCQVTSALYPNGAPKKAKLSADQPDTRTITVRIPGK